MTDFYPHPDPCHRCAATAWECIGEFVPKKGRRDDVLECAFCGLRTRVPAPYRPVARPLRASAAEFTFATGRFQGLTLAEVDAEPNGRRYLDVMRGTNELIAAYLDETALDEANAAGQIVAESQQPEGKECHASPQSLPP